MKDSRDLSTCVQVQVGRTWCQGAVGGHFVLCQGSAQSVWGGGMVQPQLQSCVWKAAHPPQRTSVLGCNPPVPSRQQ